jgi:hypothetical protein
MRAIARRFGYGSLVALGVLIVTGWAMASHYELWDSSTLQWKLGLVAAVIGLALLTYATRSCTGCRERSCSPRS